MATTKEPSAIAHVYASLIIKGLRTFSSVPEKLKPEVRQVLTDMGLEYLCED